MRAFALALSVMPGACSDAATRIDGSTPAAFARTTAVARTDLPIADRLIFDSAIATMPARRYANHDPAATARAAFDGLTASDVVHSERGRLIGETTMTRLMLLTAAAMGLAGVAFAQPAASPATPSPAKLSLTRLDCGSIAVSDLDVFSDTFLYPGRSRTLTDSCYLIRHGDQVMIWDTGLSASLVGQPAMTSGPFSMSMKQTLVAQLARVGIKPGDVDLVGISHYHDDHTGQAAAFPGATLVMGKADFEAAKQYPPAQKAFAPWIAGTSKVDPVEGDKDVFGDGRVVVLAMPGHTPGHQALLVRLASGAVLLSGDQYHFTEQVANRGVPSFNTNRADTLASSDRFDRIAKKLRAKVIIQHEPADVAKLPAFPKAAE